MFYIARATTLLLYSSSSTFYYMHNPLQPLDGNALNLFLFFLFRNLQKIHGLIDTEANPLSHSVKLWQSFWTSRHLVKGQAVIYVVR